jgi:hypothetical protein
MWASGVRYQTSATGKLNSLHWTGCSRSTPEDSGDGGWLAIGSEDGNVGINWISTANGCTGEPTRCTEQTSNGSFYKSNFNLRGHIGGVRFVRWRPQGDKLVTYDSWGNLKIWKNRANVLALDHETTTTVVVKDIQWSHCGNYIALCGEDGHLQMFSGVTGMNLFSVQVITSSLSNTYAQFTTLTWNESTTRLAICTDHGEVMDADPSYNGRFISTTIVRETIPILYAKYFGPVKEYEVETVFGNQKLSTQSLSLYLANGEVAIFQNLSSTHCMCVHTRIINGKAQWNSTESVLAIVGCPIFRGRRGNNQSCLAARLIDGDGNILLTIEHLISIQPRTDASLQCICWSLDDTTLFLCDDNHLYSLTIDTNIPSLIHLCREYIITQMLKDKNMDLNQLPLPPREIKILNVMSPSLLPSLIDTTFQSSFFTPLSQNTRLHCIVIPEDEGTGIANSFVLKYEHFGLYVPLLKAKKSSGKFFSIKYAIQDVSNKESSKDSKLKFANKFGSVTTVDDEAIGANREEDCSVIAEIEGNSLTNRYKFLSTSSSNRVLLGVLNIHSHYAKRLPRDLTAAILHDGKKITLHSIKPEWNPIFGIFELDFGGRINRDSVKNFQLDHNGEVVSP